MSRKDDSARFPDFSSSGQMSDAEERELKDALAEWRAPDISVHLDQRVLDSYRQEIKNAPVSEPIFNREANVLLPSSHEEVRMMKQCPTCQEEFANKFSFCPVDGTPLGELAAALVSTPAPDAPQSLDEKWTIEAEQEETAYARKGEYNLTIIEDTGLVSRLSAELRAVAHASQLTWPEFKADPIGFTRRSTIAYSTLFWRFITQPNVAIGFVTAFVLVLTALISLVAADNYRLRKNAELAARQEQLTADQIIDIPNDQPEPDKGTAGTNKGNGGGSKPKFDKPGGGGGGGREEQKPASAGKLPQASLTVPQVVAPDPHPPTVKNPSMPVAASLVADPVLFPPDARPLNYGDSKSKSTEVSSGPGTGNGIGTGTGGGVGSGEGGGVGPGRNGNTGGGDPRVGGGGPGGGGGGGDYDRTFRPGEVTQKARILSRPEPQYTEEARKNQISGTVVLKAVFSANGTVTNIRPVSQLPFGLTEKAITAARQIKFVPAQKDGHAVSQYIQIEYNFNLY